MKKKSTSNIEDRFVEIDIDQLDKEWIEQPKLYFKWSTKLADARLVLDEAKANLDLTIAELDQEIRADPEAFGVEKGTEGEIKQLIPMQVRYTDAQHEVHTAQHQVNILQAGVNALDHRKRALEKLVDLISLQWFSEPKATERSRDAVRDLEQRSARKNYRRTKGD